MANEIKTTVLPAGPTKRIWVNKHHLPQFGGADPKAPVWEVECEGKRYRGFRVVCPYWTHWTRWQYDPEQPEHGPHAWVETEGELRIETAAEEAV